MSPITRTPLNATLLTTATVLVLALLLPLEQLADLTARIILIVFALINLALVRIKAREREAPANPYVAPRWIPWAGLVSCLGLVAIDLVLMLAAWMP